MRNIDVTRGLMLVKALSTLTIGVSGSCLDFEAEDTSMLVPIYWLEVHNTMGTKVSSMQP